QVEQRFVDVEDAHARHEVLLTADDAPSLRWAHPPYEPPGGRSHRHARAAFRLSPGLRRFCRTSYTRTAAKHAARVYLLRRSMLPLWPGVLSLEPIGPRPKCLVNRPSRRQFLQRWGLGSLALIAGCAPGAAPGSQAPGPAGAPVPARPPALQPVRIGVPG